MDEDLNARKEIIQKWQNYSLLSNKYALWAVYQTLKKSKLNFQKLHLVVG